jgi:quercetin dioxygenase-like cupin family protein
MRWGSRIRIGLVFVTGIAVGAVAQHLAAATPTFTETPLLRSDLAGIDNHELLVSRLETSPGWAHGRHHHAGHEIVYVLDGTGVLEVDGKPEQRLTPGTAAYVPPGQIHAGRNTGRAGSFKFLLIRLHVKGQPLSVELH